MGVPCDPMQAMQASPRHVRGWFLDVPVTLSRAFSAPRNTPDRASAELSRSVKGLP